MNDAKMNHLLMSMVLQKALCASLELFKDQVVPRGVLVDPPLEGPWSPVFVIIESTPNRRLCLFLLLRTLLYSASICSVCGSLTDFWSLSCVWNHLSDMGSLGLLSTSSRSMVTCLGSLSPRVGSVPLHGEHMQVSR